MWAKHTVRKAAKSSAVSSTSSTSTTDAVVVRVAEVETIAESGTSATSKASLKGSDETRGHNLVSDDTVDATFEGSVGAFTSHNRLISVDESACMPTSSQQTTEVRSPQNTANGSENNALLNPAAAALTSLVGDVVTSSTSEPQASTGSASGLMDATAAVIASTVPSDFSSPGKTGTSPIIGSEAPVLRRRSLLPTPSPSKACNASVAAVTTEQPNDAKVLFVTDENAAAELRDDSEPNSCTTQMNEGTTQMNEGTTHMNEGAATGSRYSYYEARNLLINQVVEIAKQKACKQQQQEHEDQAAIDKEKDISI